MMNLIGYIEKVFQDRDKGKYDTIYIMVDIHNTILMPTFDKKENFVYYPYSKEVLQRLSKDPRVKLIMWTSSYDDKTEMYLNHFRDNNIIFDFINENPQYHNVSFACFDKKFYYDIGIDDKFGFEAERDWNDINNLLKKIYND